jgi:putative ABC transport system ATP-binding protein
MIEFKKIVKTFGDSKQSVTALDSVDMKIENGEFVSIMGPSGSGKSTMLNIIGCLDSPTSGTYLLDGKDVAGLNLSQKAHIRNKNFGFVFQSFNLINDRTALENVMLPLKYSRVPKKERKARAEKVLDEVGILSLKDRYPNEMSGGQQQRVAIARALVNDPDVILADEPTGNLDSKTSIEIINLLRELHECRQKTIALITHDAKVAAYAGRNIQIVDGRITSDEQLGGNMISFFKPFPGDERGMDADEAY